MEVLNSFFQFLAEPVQALFFVGGLLIIGVAIYQKKKSQKQIDLSKKRDKDWL